MSYAQNQRDPFYATGLSRMTAAGQRFARGIDTLIRRSPALAPHLWVGSGYRTSSSEHILGRALDIIAWEVGQRARTAKPAAYAAMQRLVHEVLVPNAKALHIRHIIWDRRIYRTRYGAWGALPGRTASSGVSDWHEDHAHVLLEPSTPGWLPSLDRVTVQQVSAPPKPAPAPRPRVSLSEVQAHARRRGRSASESVRTVQRALLAENIRTVGPADGWWGPKTTAAYAYWQYWLGYRGRDADGIPGRVTLARLGQRQGFDVVS